MRSTSSTLAVAAAVVLLVCGVVAQSQANGPAPSVDPSLRGVEQESCRYQWFEGRWWYSLSPNRWAYCENGQWRELTPSSTQAARNDDGATGPIRYQTNYTPAYDSVGSGESAGGSYNYGYYAPANSSGASGARIGGGVAVPGWGW